MNKPIDMIVYQQAGQTYLLMANSKRGVMKISTADIGKNEGLTNGSGAAAVPRGRSTRRSNR